MIEENKKLELEMKKVKSEMQDAVRMVETDKGDESAEEDDEDEEPPPDFYKNENQMGKARASVSAEAYGEWNTKKAFVPPVIVKTQDQKDRLKATLSKSFLFQPLEDN